MSLLYTVRKSLCCENWRSYYDAKIIAAISEFLLVPMKWS